MELNKYRGDRDPYWDFLQGIVDSMDAWWGLLERDPEAAEVLAEAEAILAAHQEAIRSGGGAE